MKQVGRELNELEEFEAPYVGTQTKLSCLWQSKIKTPKQTKGQQQQKHLLLSECYFSPWSPSGTQVAL